METMTLPRTMIFVTIIRRYIVAIDRPWSNGTSWGRFYRVSTTTAEYHKKVSEGEELPCNDFEQWIYSGTNPITFWKSLGKDYNQPYSNFKGFRWSLTDGRFYNSGGASIPVPTWTDMLNDIELRLSDKVRDNEFNLAFTLAEFPETIGFIAGAVKRTARALKRAKRGDFAGAIKTLSGFKRQKRWQNRNVPSAIDVAADAQLGYALSLRPLVADVANAAEYLEKRRLRQQVLAVNSRLVRDVNLSLPQENYNPQHLNHSAFLTGQVILSGGVRYVIDNPLLYTLENLGFINPFSVAWELAPLSFVADWFLPIDSFIQNLIPPQGVEFVSGWKALRAHGTFVNVQEKGEDESLMRVTETWKIREKLTGFPTPRFRVPDLSLSKGKMATGMALLWKAAGR